MRDGILLGVFVCAIEFAAFLVWVVVPYGQVLAARGDTNFVAGELFRADGRTREAISMYQLALDRDTIYMSEAVARLDALAPHAPGESFNADDLMAQVDQPPIATIAPDSARTISGDRSLKISIPGSQEASASAMSDWIAVEPNAVYELSGWVRAENVYGSGYGVIGWYEDNGSWKEPRKTDMIAWNETSGWRSFRKTITTLPTTHRVMLSAGLWETYGTVWIDSLELARIPNQ